MHLPPEVERLAPELIGRVAEPGAIDPAAEAERIETLILAGDPQRWLEYLRERGRMLVARAGSATDPTDRSRLAAILRDQLVLIQATIDLGREDLKLLEALERLESGEPAV